jgi:hypothetical protein
MLDLSKKFGKNKAFKDDELFNEITNMTYPEIGDFFNKYVKGIEPLPYARLMESFGVEYVEEERFKDYSLGIGSSDINAIPIENKPRLYIATTEHLNEMGKALGFQKDDVLIKINGETIPDLGPQLGEFFARHRVGLKDGGVLSYGVLRRDANGELKEIELKANVIQIELSRKHLLAFKGNATSEQLALRDSWLKP